MHHIDFVPQGRSVNPFMHYKPVASVLSNLDERIAWAAHVNEPCAGFSVNDRSLAESKDYETKLVQAAQRPKGLVLSLEHELETKSIDLSFGVLYVATGLPFLQEAIASARSLHSSNPEIPIAIFTNIDVSEHCELFDIVRIIENAKYDSNDKIFAIANSPFEKTVFIDTDTRILCDISDLRRLLERFDIALALDPIRSDQDQPSIPDCFPTLNSGLIAYRRNAKTAKLFDEWLMAFRSQPDEPGKTRRDQPPFRKVMWESDVRYAVLPDEYNLRVIFEHMIGGNAYVKVLHGRHEKLEIAMKYAKTTHFYPRVFGRKYTVKELTKMLAERIYERAGIRLGWDVFGEKKRTGQTFKY
jgi:hypothetical protein